MSTIQTVVFGYMLLVFGLAYYGFKRTKTLDDHLVAGRSLPWWLASATLAATVIGTGVTIGVGEVAYKVGLSAILYPVTLAVTLFLSMRIAAARFRRSESYTISELMSQHYGPLARYIVSFSHVVMWIGPTAAQFLVAGILLNSLTGLPLTTSIVLGAFLIILYVSLGGMWAISLTDMAQLILIYIGLASLAILSIARYGNMFSIASSLGPNYTSPTGAGVMPLTAWLGALVALVFITQPWLQKCASVKTPGDAKKAGAIAALLVLPIGFLSVYAGLVARLTLPGIDPRAAIPQVIISNFNPIIAGLFFAAVIAAAMSSSDSWLHASATILLKDIILHGKKTEGEERKIGFYNIFSIWALGAVALVLSLLWKGQIIMLVLFTGMWGSPIYIGPLVAVWFAPRRLAKKAGLGIMLFLLVLGPALTTQPGYVFGVHPLLSVSVIAWILTIVGLMIPWTSVARSDTFEKSAGIVE